MEDSVSSVDIPAVSQAKMVINILIKTAANTFPKTVVVAKEFNRRFKVDGECLITAETSGRKLIVNRISPVDVVKNTLGFVVAKFNQPALGALL